MKKILTLLFFAGFLTTAAFAQEGGRRWQNNNQYNNDRHSSYGNRGDYEHQWRDRRDDDRRDHDGWDRDRRERWDRDRRDGWDGDGDWRFHRHYRDYDDDREIVAYPYGYSRPQASLQIVIGRHR